MNCDAFERWLDEGRPEVSAVAARAHAEGCRSCAARHGADLAVERAMAAAPASAPDRFTDRVMARVRTRRALAAAAPALPWWIRVGTDPATVVAMVACGLLAWGWEGLWAVAHQIGSWSGMTAMAAPPGGLDPSVALAIQVAVGALLALGAPAIVRAVARLPLTRA